MRENRRFKLTEALFGGVPCNETATKAVESCNNGICPGMESLKSAKEHVQLFFIFLRCYQFNFERC